MAVAWITADAQTFRDLAAYLEREYPGAMRRLVRELKRAADRPGHRAELTDVEIDSLRGLPGEVPGSEALARAAGDIDRARAYEAGRDADMDEVHRRLREWQ